MSPAEIDALLTAVKRLSKECQAQQSEMQQMKLQIARMRQQINKVFDTTTTTWMTKRDFVTLLKSQDVLRFAAGKQRAAGDDIRFFNSKLREDNPLSTHEGPDTPPHGTAVWKKSERITLFHCTYAFEEFVAYYRGD